MSDENLKGIFKPDGGWVPSTWYIVHVKATMGNVVYRALLFTGFLDKNGDPAGYSGVMAVNYADDEVKPVGKFYYLKPIMAVLDNNGHLCLELNKV